jgi:hypothetical protein
LTNLRSRLALFGALAVMLALLLAALGAVATVSAAGNTLRITPPSTPVAAVGTSFTVHVVQNALVPTSGAQATITFDQTKVQITSVAKGAGYAGAALFLGASPANITTANASGSLKTVAAAYFAGTGPTPIGDQDFLDIVFKATACGTSTIGLPIGAADAVLTDANGATLAVTTTGGTVALACPTAPPTPSPSAKPSPSPSSAPSASPSPSPKPSASPVPSASPSAAPSASPSSAPSTPPSASPSPVETPVGTPAPTAGNPTPTPSGAVLAATATPPSTDTLSGPPASPPAQGTPDVWMLVIIALIVIIASADLVTGKRGHRRRR